MDNSQHLEKAKQRLEAVRGRSLTVEERREAAIELAALVLNEARRVQTNVDRRAQAQIAHMMKDPNGKAFTTDLSDQCFRSENPKRVADQMVYLIRHYGVPRYLSLGKKIKVLGFKWLGKKWPKLSVAWMKRVIRKETGKVIFPADNRKLRKHMRRRLKENIRVNLNHLGEAVLGEEEAERRLQVYLDDLARPEVEYISVKISTICSQLNLLSWDDTLEILSDRLKRLYRAASAHEYVRHDRKRVPKFVNLDMEGYHDLHLTIELFRHVLDDAEFQHHSAGIVLQSYLPDSYLLQQALTVWAMQRVANGGAPIKIRIVKGANLAMEHVEASLRGWPQAPYTVKADVDANFKRMLHYGCNPENAAAAHIGVGSHNLFDIAYALLLRTEKEMDRFVEFEMLEGMADHIRTVIQTLSGDMLLYCPVAAEKEFQNAVAYLIRRLDENSGPDNFLRHMFKLIPGTKQWQRQANFFSYACHHASAVSMKTNRYQNRHHEPIKLPLDSEFVNEPDTDWVLPHNRRWGQEIVKKWSRADIGLVPLVIGGRTILPESKAMQGAGQDPSYPGQELYQYTLATLDHLDEALKTAERCPKIAVAERSQLLAEVAHLLRVRRADLIGVMVADAGKTVVEADIEISEAIDFAEYYRRNMEEWNSLEDIRWKPKGTILIAPPWNFPCSIPMGGILAALVTGNQVIFKPAPESVLVGWHLAQICWEAGVSREMLQFLTCEDDTVGSALIQDPRVAAVILTGATTTAKHLLQLRPGLDLMAETGGKNTLIITSMADRDLALHDLIQSAFDHSGQKCSACSLAICEAEVYDDPHFRQQLRDAVASLPVGSPWNLKTRINPLIRVPNPTLMRALTTLEEGEEWLLEPHQDPDNPHLWSPGVKLGVREESFTYQNELFGPVLGLMRADSLEHAIQLANGTPYGLTAGIHTLDEREQKQWIKQIQAGNCYINRGITGAIVRRQPFGGCKESSFGPGAKAGGPNYLTQMMWPEQVALPRGKAKVGKEINGMTRYLKKSGFSRDQLNLWNVSIGNYLFFWQEYFSQDHDPSKVLGQHNILRYVPRESMILRVSEDDDLLDIMRVIAAAAICGTPLEVSGDPIHIAMIAKADWTTVIEEDDAQFAERMQHGSFHRVRVLSGAVIPGNCYTIRGPVQANGRLELLHYLREVSLSINYHRYGNIHHVKP